MKQEKRWGSPSIDAMERVPMKKGQLVEKATNQWSLRTKRKMKHVKPKKTHHSDSQVTQSQMLATVEPRSQNKAQDEG